MPDSEDNPSFSSNDAKAIPVPASLLKKIISKDFQKMIKDKVEQLLQESTEFGVLDERNKIHNYVYYVMQTLNLTNKSWRIETKKCLNRREGR